ncbi:MAG TPA: polyprenyl diphosphate synthase [Chloroflexia bacterium]|nr:polyprenyl diphosphate synthase [Chloroflexia bacterium]
MSEPRPRITPVPRHVAMIMDGNGRWAKQRGLPRLAGHRAGTENIRNIVQACVEQGVEYMTLYAFSTENWSRPDNEVQGLLRILAEVIERETPELDRNGVQLRHLGSMDGVPQDLADAINGALAFTAHNNRLILSVAFNYGGRAEIVEAVRRIVRAGLPADAIDEAAISEHLYTADIPDPDLIVRTAGEQRLSNYLIWQAAYAEYWFTPVYWPDFDKDVFYEALAAFSRRKRKFGMTEDQVASPA